MRSERNRDSRYRNHFKQRRKRQRAAKGQLHRAYLQQRLALLSRFLHQFREGQSMPQDWLGLYPELSAVLPQIDSVDNLLWLLNEELGRWFFLLRGPTSAAHGMCAKYPSAWTREDGFFLDLICMSC